MQEGFLRAIPGRDALVARVAFAVRAARLLGWPVRFSEQVPEKLGTTIPELEPSSEEVFAKTAFSAFGAAGLGDTLRAASIHHLLLAGIETPICVYQTAVEALRRDFDVTILTDAVGARRPNDAAAALIELRSAGCHAVPAETVFYSLLGDAQHAAFKAFTQLVKAAN